MAKTKQHFVTFLSPGTLCAEESTLRVDSWDVAKAIKMSETIVERHGARPFGFCFTTRVRRGSQFDSAQETKSGMYYLGGTVRTIGEVRREARSDERILLSNMELNRYRRVVQNNNSWLWTAPLLPGDKVLDYTPPTRTRSDI